MAKLGRYLLAPLLGALMGGISGGLYGFSAARRETEEVIYGYKLVR